MSGEPKMSSTVAPSKCSSSMATTSHDLLEDDGSVFTEDKGVRKNIRPGDFVRACGVMEAGAAIGHRYKIDTTVMPVWFESKKKLLTDDVLEALWIVSRQVPHLQFCHAKRRGKLWFKRMKKLEIDFSTTSKNELDVCHEMFDTVFDLWNGPLWKVMLIESKDKTVNGRFCTILIFVILHSLNDGVTNIKIVKDFVFAMNRLSDNQQVTPVFSPVITPIDKMAKEEAKFKYFIKKCFKHTFVTFYQLFKNEIYFSKILPIPKIKDAKTRILIDNFTENETQKLLKMCKDEKITLNTFICTIANFALLSVAQSRSSVPIGRRKIRMMHSINHRRYFEPQYNDASGYHASAMEEDIKISLADAEDFWETARKNHSNFLKRLNTKREHLKTLPLMLLALENRPINRFLAINGFKGLVFKQYASSNMGNLNKLLADAKEDDNVHVTYLTRSCSSQFNGILFGLFFQTLRQKLILSMDYYTNFITKDVAQEIFDAIYTLVRNVVNHDRMIITK